MQALDGFVSRTGRHSHLGLVPLGQELADDETKSILADSDALFGWQGLAK